MSIRDVVAANLKALRAARQLSQEDLADLVGIDRTYVSALERCKYAASVDILERIAIALDVEVRDLVTAA